MTQTGLRPSAGLSSPQLVMERLEEIDRDLQSLANAYEAAALAWFRSKRTREHRHAVEFMAAANGDRTVAERAQIAARESCQIGMEDEALYEALKAKERVLSTRASIGQSILKAQARA
jgi:hypothetical protein